MTGSDKGQLPQSNWVEPGGRPHRSLCSIDAARPPASIPATKPPLYTGTGNLKRRLGLESVEVRCRSENSRPNGQCEPGNRALVGGWRSVGNRNGWKKENILAHKRTVRTRNVPKAGKEGGGGLSTLSNGRKDRFP